MSRKNNYWQRREAEALKHYVKEEKEYDKRVNRIYSDMLAACQNEIDAFYGKYASKEGISITEAKKRCSKLDIAAYERKAKKYVEDAARDRKANGGKTNFAGDYFSKKANEEMELYNLTMKVNRLELLKANIGLELVKGHAELEGFMGEILEGRTLAELQRQAGILGKTVLNNAQKAHAIVNASFNNATFSDRIWMYQDMMKADLSKMLQSGLIQGKNPRALAKELRRYFKGDERLKNGKSGAIYNTERLMRTELARVQTEAQKQSFERNGFDYYEFIVNGGCCPICEAIAGDHFKVSDMMPGKNAPPMHPHCRCSTAAYEDEEDYEAWLDYLETGGTTISWQEMKKQSAQFELLKSDSWEKFREREAVPERIEDIYSSDRGLMQGTRARTHYLLEEAGYTGKPTKLSESEYRKEVEKTGIELFRGTDKKQYNDALLKGEFFLGKGAYGHGTYGSTMAADASGYGSEIISYSIKNDAKIVEHKELWTMLQKDIEVWDEKRWDKSYSRDERHDFSDMIQFYEADISRYAVQKGYDVIKVTGDGGFDEKTGKKADFYCVVNRAKIIYSGG